MGYKEEENRGERASLADSGPPAAEGGGEAVDLSCSLCLGEKELSLLDHACRGPQNILDSVQEVTINGVKGLGDIKEE